MIELQVLDADLQQPGLFAANDDGEVRKYGDRAQIVGEIAR